MIKVFPSKGEDTVCLTIYQNKETDILVEIEKSDADDNGEASVQLCEGCHYHYKISEGFQLDPIPGVVQPFIQPDLNTGLIETGIYTGTLRLLFRNVKNPDNLGYFDLEIQSKKTDYRSDYRFMLEEIAEKCTELILEHSSPVIQKVEPNFDIDQKALYQKFAFLKSFIGSDDFFESINRIVMSPVTKWSYTEKTSDVRNLGRINAHTVRQIASSSRRLPLSEGIQFNSKINSLPNRISTLQKHDSIDTPENQFIKYALTEYYIVCLEISSKLHSGSREQKEAEKLTEDLRNVLDRPRFREISNPHVLQFNSPVLQRKEGYREVYRSWLMFNIASKLVWRGGTDVYEAGKKDVARLYEYWVFFKLFDLVDSVFTFPIQSLDNLIVSTEDNLNLTLRAGKTTTINGSYHTGSRNLNVTFSYNKTFSGSEKENYPKSGSWTRAMRPDYTLSVWPSEFTLQEAEEQELIVHIHFDAKYRVENLEQAFGPSTPEAIDDLHEMETSEEKGVYKRGDLLKMHAYKDAIRRTAGAYVLYPGSKNKTWKGFHEIIPGLGAFTVRPDKSDDGTKDLKDFIRQVVDQLVNRASQHENSTYYLYETYSKPPLQVKEPLPEKVDGKRIKPPSEQYVLIGYCKSNRQKDWIRNNRLYNIRLDAFKNEDKRLQQNETSSAYLLLHHEGELVTSDFWRLSEEGPKLVHKSDLLEMDYPDPSGDDYLLYTIEPETNESLIGCSWDIRKLPGYKGGIQSPRPFAVSLIELMKVKINRPE